MKKILALFALFLCTLGTAFADTHCNSEAEFYRDLEQSARKHRWCYIVEVWEDNGGHSGFYFNYVEGGAMFYYEGIRDESIYVIVADDKQFIEDAIAEEFDGVDYIWRSCDLQRIYNQTIALIKAHIEVCK